MNTQHISCYGFPNAICEFKLPPRLTWHALLPPHVYPAHIMLRFSKRICEFKLPPRLTWHALLPPHVYPAHIMLLITPLHCSLYLARTGTLPMFTQHISCNGYPKKHREFKWTHRLTGHALLPPHVIPAISCYGYP